MTPVAAATVAPIVATNTVPSTTAIGSFSTLILYSLVKKHCNVLQKIKSEIYCSIVYTNATHLHSYLGTVPHTQMTNSTIVTMTMASHSSHATAVTTSTIPVGKLALC